MKSSKAQQMLADEALARRLEQEEAAARAAADRLRQEREEEDAELAEAIALSLSLSTEDAAERASIALAQALQAEDDAEAAAAQPPVRSPYLGTYPSLQRSTIPGLPTPTAHEIDSLEPAIQRVAAITAQAVDIHGHTRALGAICRDNFVPMDDRYQLSFFGDIQVEFNRIRPAIEAMALAADKAAVQTILNAIAAKPGVIEPETGLNMMSLLVKTWALAEKSGAKENKSLIIDNLKHNIAAQGGCNAGIAARLVQTYTALLHVALQNASGLYGNRRVRISYHS